MKKLYCIFGADMHTAKDVELLIDADTESEAIQNARDQGVFVSRVEMLPNPEPAAAPLMPESEAHDPVRCPRCGSTQLTANKKGFGLGKAAVGGVLFGGVGLLGGMIGGNKIKITCLKCGHTFQPGQGG